MPERSDSAQSERIVRAVFTLTMSESIDSDTLVHVDPLEVAHISGAPLDEVTKVLDWLVAVGAADGA